MRKYLNLRHIICQGLIFAFFINTIGPVGTVQAQDFVLPAPGVMVYLSPAFNPPILKGIKVHSDNPFRFDFILDKGDSPNSPSLVKEGDRGSLKQEATKLIKYFLASLTIPEKDLWVNLSPYEKDRIIPNSFGLTEMGRDLLAEDYMLKQITASLIYPEDEAGKRFWKRIYEEAAKRYGTTNVPVNTFNKVWIVPEKAVVYENPQAGTAYIVEAKLKVMLEQDYLALQKQLPLTPSLTKEGGIFEKPPLFYKEGDRGSSKDINALGFQIVREIVIPELTKEVNENKNFAHLRQVYNSLILATWYKKKIKDSILEQVYADKKKIAGVGYANSLPLAGRVREGGDIEAIYQRYLQAFKKGVYNYIKEDVEPATQETVPRKYFSGGVALRWGVDGAMTTLNHIDYAQLGNKNNLVEVSGQIGVASRAMVNPDPFVASLIAQPFIQSSVRQKGIEFLRMLQPEINKDFLQQLGWGDGNYSWHLRDLADRFIFPVRIKDHFDLEIRLFSDPGYEQPHVVLLGIFKQKGTDQIKGYFELDIVEDTDGRLWSFRSGLFFDKSDPLIHGMSEAYRQFINKMVYPLLHVSKERIRANFTGRYVWAGKENGFEFLPLQGGRFNYSYKDTNGEVVSIAEIARRNLRRLLENHNKYNKDHQIKENDLLVGASGLPIHSINDLTEPYQFATLRHRLGWKVIIQPLLGELVLGELTAMDVGKAFLLANYRYSGNGPYIESIDGDKFNPYAMPVWLGQRPVGSAAMGAEGESRAMTVEEHKYTRVTADSGEGKKLYERILQSEDARKRYVKGLIGEIVKSAPGSLIFEDIDREWNLLEAVTLERVFHQGFFRDEHGIYWILKRREINPREDLRGFKNDKKREMLAYLLLRGKANLAEIRDISDREAEDLGVVGSPEGYYLSRVVSHDNVDGILPHHERPQAFSSLFVAHIFLRKDDPHPWNLAFVGNDIPVSIDQDHTNLYDRHLVSTADFREFISKNFLFDSIVRPVMNFIAPENLWPLLEENTIAFKSDEELFQKLHLGVGYVRNEGLDKNYIIQAINAIKSITNIQALAQEAGYSGEDLKDVVQYVESNQRHLGADVDFVWKDLTGKSGGFQVLDEAMANAQLVQKRELTSSVKKTGGIDLTPANMNVQVKTGSPTKTFGDDSGGGIKFHLDSAMLEQLQNAPGFVPVIINIQPMANLRVFLGLSDAQSSPQAASL